MGSGRVKIPYKNIKRSTEPSRVYFTQTMSYFDMLFGNSISGNNDLISNIANLIYGFREKNHYIINTTGKPY
jgi:hypothetical protein